MASENDRPTRIDRRTDATWERQAPSIREEHQSSNARNDHKGDHEITALVGNITTMDGKPYLHLHITCAASDGTVCAGHLIQGRISLPAEIVVDIIEGELIRKRSEELNINLIDFE